ncbi:Rrf2 family transcriptional regulator [Lactococcus nasutitermitis]|uniref:Rrf2 family transcriptional regulator n=1 Tax=Lactococcus nasutitermitis TaxID=1652957 RepID=A0ABV9JEC1_9LACT|nr:Rrf2 family transcriptional regulator [Lactococcus nasutitermitis]
MKLSLGWEQSIYVLLILSRLPDDKTLNSLALSERLEVSQSYLKKIIKQLVNEGLIKSTAGKFGGFSLAKSLEEITFYDVFLAIEGRGKIFSSQQLLKKFLGKKEGAKAKKCAITNALDTIEVTLVKTLSNISLAQVAKETQGNYTLVDLDKWIGEHDK